MPEIDSVYKASRIAYCPNIPDTADGQAREFLQECIDTGSSLNKAAARERFSEEGVEDLIPEYAERCIPIYRWRLWMTWAQLGGYDVTDNDWRPVPGGRGQNLEYELDLDKIAQADCYMWAEQIIRYMVEYS